MTQSFSEETSPVMKDRAIFWSLGLALVVALCLLWPHQREGSHELLQQVSLIFFGERQLGCGALLCLRGGKGEGGGGLGVGERKDCWSLRASGDEKQACDE